MSRVATYSGPFLRGLSPSMAICLDQSENTVPCSDPDCTYGDCGASGPQLTTGALCLDRSQNQVLCSDPSCFYGDCPAPSSTPRPGTVATTLPIAVAASTVSRPANVVNVPLSASSFGLFLTSSTLISGVPNVAILGAALLAAVALLGTSGRRR